MKSPQLAVSSMNPVFRRETILRPAGVPTHFASMGEGLVGLQLLGSGNKPEALAVADWFLDAIRIDPNMKDINQSGWPFLGTFLLREAFVVRGGAGEAESRNFAERNLVVGQSADGAWTDNFEGRYVGRVYCTSLAVMTLAARYRHLPLYQM